jgi:PqqD family protein of HPr-rel-A system
LHVWRTADPDLIFHRWPGESEAVAYSPRAGSLHLVTASAVVLLQELSARPQTAADIERFIGSGLGVSPGDVTGESVADLLRGLREAELVERAQP